MSTAAAGVPSFGGFVQGGGQFLWVNTSGRPCPGPLGGCEARNGVKRTLVEWIALGLPRTGWSYCKHRCHCVLLPLIPFGLSVAETLRKEDREVAVPPARAISARAGWDPSRPFAEQQELGPDRLLEIVGALPLVGQTRVDALELARLFREGKMPVGIFLDRLDALTGRGGGGAAPASPKPSAPPPSTPSADSRPTISDALKAATEKLKKDRAALKAKLEAADKKKAEQAAALAKSKAETAKLKAETAKLKAETAAKKKEAADLKKALEDLQARTATRQGEAKRARESVKLTPAQERYRDLYRKLSESAITGLQSREFRARLGRDPELRALFDGIDDWTGSGYMAIQRATAGDGVKYRARLALEALASQDLLAKGGDGEPLPLYRGMRLDETVARSLKPGSTFDMGSLRSWSRRSEAAGGFGHGRAGYVRSKWILPKPRRGVEIEHLSDFGDTEAETITGGRFRVTRAETATDAAGAPLLLFWVDQLD